MKAVVWHGIGDIRLDTVPDPGIQEPTDAVISITRSAICGTDLHFVRGRWRRWPRAPSWAMRPSASSKRSVMTSGASPPATEWWSAPPSGAGAAHTARAGYYAQCDVANPNGPQAGTSFFGGPQSTCPVNGLQAEYARIPYAAVTLVPIPERITDDRRS